VGAIFGNWKWYVLIFVIWIVMLIAVVIITEEGSPLYNYIGPGLTDLLFFIVMFIPFLAIAPFLIKVFGLILGLRSNGIFGGDKDSERILKEGLPGTATILRIGESSEGGIITINDQPYVNLVLSVDNGNNKPYEVSIDMLIPRTAVPQFQPGMKFPVRIDSKNPQKIVLDENGTITDEDNTIDVGEKWSDEDREHVKNQGIDGIARIRSVEDTGKSENFMAIVRIKYDIIPASESKIKPYKITRKKALSTESIQQLAANIGKNLKARIHPRDKQKVWIDIE